MRVSFTSVVYQNSSTSASYERMNMRWVLRFGPGTWMSAEQPCPKCLAESTVYDSQSSRGFHPPEEVFQTGTSGAPLTQLQLRWRMTETSPQPNFDRYDQRIAEAMLSG